MGDTVGRLAARNIGKMYAARGRQVEVLRDITFAVEPGEFVVVVGPSGCGKTTLLRILNGLIAPNSGEITIDGHPLEGLGKDRGFVFQQDSLFPWRTTLDNVRLGLEIRGVPKQESVDRARFYIKLVGLEGFEHHYPHQLSGGMRQRANLARALAIDPRVLLMDEPFAALDAQTREIMQSELLNLWSRHKITIVFITHQIDEAVYLADRVVVLSARPGRIKAVVPINLGRPRDLSIKRDPVFLDHVEAIWQMIDREARAAMEILPDAAP